MSYSTALPEDRKRKYFWAPRRYAAIKRTMSSPAKKSGDEDKTATPNSAMVAECELAIEQEMRRERASDYNGARDSGVWVQDVSEAASTGTAIREEVDRSDDSGVWASNLFYVYARQTDDPRFSRFLITFCNARICSEWWSLIQIHFGGSPTNTREGSQFFSFMGNDLPGRAGRHQAFAHLRTRWMYSQIGDAIGTMGKGQEVIPLQDERGFLVMQGMSSKPPEPFLACGRTSSRTSSIVDSTRTREERMSKPIRLTTKRDSGVLLSNSPLFNHNHERSFSLPLMSPVSQPQYPVSDQPINSFDFSRMEANLSKIERLLESNASQMRSLEHVQAANLERLTAAIIQNAEMIRDIGLGQQKLGEACEALRKTVGEGLDTSHVYRQKDHEGSPGSVDTSGVGSLGKCGHEMKKGPRKIGRTVIGYIYEDNSAQKDQFHRQSTKG